MERSNIFFTVSQKRALEKEALKEKCAIADIVRRLVDAWIREKQ